MHGVACHPSPWMDHLWVYTTLSHSGTRPGPPDALLLKVGVLLALTADSQSPGWINKLMPGVVFEVAVKGGQK